MSKVFTEYSKTVDEVSKLKELDEQTLVTPIKENAWSIREIIGHMYYWDDSNLHNMISQMQNGANLPAFPNHDAQNEKAIQSLEGQTVYQIIDLFLARREDFLEAIRKVDKQDRFTIGNGKRAFSSESFVKIFVKHDAHHLKQIDYFLASS
ncbi:DinB family protein [Oceanobacillus jeddahense]|uniref:DinB family protein n=1 Tax=Oceanobacillus jeddahense TaxID=1462527 RepID=A0ABY5JU88_9BACI|nr:DinB family protein [Oceanobacillus jeddahense]UUI03734.1 DinB family protein [Oceanobacillus jeddahense]